MSRENYIQHITGLRGLAILMVVLFHLSPSAFSNGFYGVDVFFVIMGYLLFYGGKKEQNFSLGNFLKRKVIRIYPSLCVLILFSCVCIAPFLYDILQVSIFGKSCLYSILGVSNLYYIIAYADYFATDSSMNALLHTWFLSVTVQIYLFWAVGSVIFRRASKITKIICVLIIVLASFLYYFSHSIQQIIIDCGYNGWGQTSRVSYYDTLGRLWQIFAGGLVCVLPAVTNRISNILFFLVGLAILIVSAFCNLALPEWASIGVILGTVLVLRYAGDAQIPVLLENKIILFLGKISFSLYLVHFPIIVFYRHWERKEPDIICSMVLLAISVVTAWIFYRYIETHRFSKRIGLVLFVFTILLSCFARGAKKLGVQWDSHIVPYPVYQLTEEHIQFPDSVYSGYNEHLLKADRGTRGYLRSNSEVFPIHSISGSNKNPEFVLVGNSVAQQLYAGFHEICKERNIPGIHLTTIVFPLWNYYVWFGDSYCWTKDKAAAFTEWLRHQPDLHTVVVSFLWKGEKKLTKFNYTNWDGFLVAETQDEILNNAKEFCKQVQKTGKNVVILTPTPVFMDFEDAALLGRGEDYVHWRNQRGYMIDSKNGEDPFVITEKEYMEFNADVFNMLCKLESEGYCKLLHIEQGIFREGNFSGLQNGKLYCRDKAHVTPAGAIFIMKGVADQFEKIIRENKSKIDTPNHELK